MGFGKDKKKSLNDLEASKAVGDVDTGIIPVLDAINSLDDYYTTSSCFGRIVLFEDRGGKGSIKHLGKWHRKADFKEISAAFKASEGVVWFRYEGPIMHVIACDIEAAQRILQILHECGFKRSGIQSIKDGRVVIEALATEILASPLAIDGEPLVDMSYLERIIPLAHEKFDASKDKLIRLEKALNALV